MKRKTMFIAPLLIGMLLSGCTPASNNGSGEGGGVNPPVTVIDPVSIELTSFVSEVEVGSEFQFIAKVNPEETTNKNIVWSISDSTVASISESGLLTGLKTGGVRVRATSEANSLIKIEKLIRVIPKYIAVESIELDHASSDLYVNETLQLTATITPSNASEGTVSWTSSNSSIASVSNGLVTAKKAGTATIYARADGKSATCFVTIKEPVVEAESISLSTSTKSLEINESVTLSVTFVPTNTTNKTVTWSTTNNTVATVNAGKVTAVGVGEATITAKTNNGKTATCKVTVSETVLDDWRLVTSVDSLIDGDKVVIAYSSSSKTATSTVKSGSGNSHYLTSVASTFTSDKKTITQLGEGTAVFTLGVMSDSTYTFVNDSNQYFGADNIKSVGFDCECNDWTIDIDSSGNATISNTDSNCGMLLYNATNPRFTTYENTSSSSKKIQIYYKPSERTPVEPTSISITSELEMAAGTSKKLTVSYEPKNANEKKEINWTSSNTDIATVDNGTVSIKGNAQIGQTVTITAALAFTPSIKSTCTITVVETAKDPYTILIYMCGADLESYYASYGQGLATMDIEEILNVKNMPEGVNIVIETGGASQWSSKYGIKANELGRYKVTTDRKLEKVESKTKANMGLQSTFEDFLSWGLETYPAQKTGLIMWNHGGAMDGVCYDENYNNDSLTNKEMNAAFNNVFTTLSITEPLEWIGYDACLMDVQDIAEFNSHYFNYMIASQETEAGEGWDYDGGWLDRLYADPSIESETLLPLICDTFISDNYSEATLTVLNLREMDTYLTAWENMAEKLSTMINSSSTWSTFKNVVNSCKKFGESEGIYYYDVFDVKDLITKLQSNSTYSSTLSVELNALLIAFNEVVLHNATTSDYKGAHGLCFFCPLGGYSYKTGSYATYTKDHTNFEKWRVLVTNYGKWAN